MTKGEVGKYKLVTLGKNSKEIDSVMFDMLDKALSYSAKIDTYIITQFVTSSNGSYTWLILPYGDYRLYEAGVFVKKYWPLLLIGVLLAAYAIWRWFFNKKPGTAPMGEGFTPSVGPSLPPTLNT